MQNKFLLIAPSFALSFFLVTNSAWSINKCTLNGSTTYTNLPCPKDAISTPFIELIDSPGDPAAAKQVHLANQQKLQEIQQQKIKEEKQEQRQAQMLTRQAKKNEAREFKCKQLKLKKQTAQQQYKKVQFKGRNNATEKAQLRAKQAEDLYEHHCRGM